MEELNNWDEDTIRHLIHKLEIDAETAELIAKNYEKKTQNASEDIRPIDKWIIEHEAVRHYGQANAYNYAVAYLREMLDNARLSKVTVCPNHEGNFDCTPFCPICEGEQETKN